QLFDEQTSNLRRAVYTVGATAGVVALGAAAYYLYPTGASTPTTLGQPQVGQKIAVQGSTQVKSPTFETLQTVADNARQGFANTVENVQNIDVQGIAGRAKQGISTATRNVKDKVSDTVGGYFNETIEGYKLAGKAANEQYDSWQAQREIDRQASLRAQKAMSQSAPNYDSQRIEKGIFSGATDYARAKASSLTQSAKDAWDSYNKPADSGVKYDAEGRVV